MIGDNDPLDDAALGQKARELVQAMVDMGALLSVDAPISALSRQLDAIEERATEVCAECGVDFKEEFVDQLTLKMDRITELLMQRMMSKKSEP